MAVTGSGIGVALAAPLLPAAVGAIGTMADLITAVGGGIGLTTAAYGVSTAAEGITGVNPLVETLYGGNYRAVYRDMGTLMSINFSIAMLEMMGAIAQASQQNANTNLGAAENNPDGKESDSIYQKGQKVLEEFDVENAYVKPKHLSSTGGTGAKFLGDSKLEAESILQDAIKNGKVQSILDNGITAQGNQSYKITIDAGKIIGTNGETLIRIILSEDGGMLSAFPVNQ